MLIDLGAGISHQGAPYCPFVCVCVCVYVCVCMCVCGEGGGDGKNINFMCLSTENIVEIMTMLLIGTLLSSLLCSTIHALPVVLA